MRKISFMVIMVILFSFSLSAQTTLVDANFATFNNDALVGQNGWQQYNIASTEPLMVNSGAVIIAGSRLVDNQDAVYPFASVIQQPASGTTIVYIDAVLTVSSAGISNPSYFLALNGLTTTTSTGNFQSARLAAIQNADGFVFGTRVTGQTGYPYAYGMTKLSFGSKYAVRLAIEMNAGNANDIVKLYVGTSFNNLQLQSTAAYNTGTVADPTFGGILISQYGSATVPEAGAAIESVKVYTVSEITTSTDQLTGFLYAPGNGPSAQQEFTVGGIGLTSGITVTAPTSYEISALPGVDFASTESMTIPASSGSVSPLTLYVRLKSGLTENTYTGNITVSSTGFTTKNIALTGKVEAPPSVVSLSTDLLDAFQYYYGSGPSTEKPFTLSGSGLTSGIAISVPASFEISALSGASFSGTNSVTIPHTNGNINNLVLYVRMKSGLAVSAYSGNITFTTNGTTSKSLALSGSVDAAPVVLNKSTSLLSGFTYGFGNGPSTSQTFTISGTGLTGSVTLTAPTNYELSSDFAVSFSNSVSFTPSGGALTSKTIYVRLKSGLNATTYSGSISISTTGATTQTINLSGSVTLPAGISISTTSISGLNYEAESGPSAINSFVVYGGSLISMIIVTAPANFEISTSGGVDFSATGQILLQHSNGLVNAVTIYVRLKASLDVNDYSGNITLSSSGQTSKSIALSGSVSMPANVSQDNNYYESRNNLSFRNRWLNSRNLGNYVNAPDLIAPLNEARGMAVKDGKMLFIDRPNKQIVRVSGSTGAKMAPVVLNSTIFSDPLIGVLPYNDIKVDNAGNVLIGNGLSTGSEQFQIWKVNLTDGTGSLVINQSSLVTLFPSISPIKFEYFNVWGDVNTNAVIYAANSSMHVFKWIITNGIAGAPVAIKISNQKDLLTLTSFSNNAQIFPVDNSKFYIDAAGTYPVLCDDLGNVHDGFNSNINNLIDSTTFGGQKITLNKTFNGMKEFKVGNEYFMITSATNNSMSPPNGLCPSTFRLFKFADANKSFATMDYLWTFPQNGMGTAFNIYRTAMPAVEVNGNTAKIYLYIGENGYGMYELSNGGWSVEKGNKTNSVKLFVSFENNRLSLSDNVQQIDIFNITGQRILSKKNINSIEISLKKGIYILNILTENGIRQTEKIFIK